MIERDVNPPSSLLPPHSSCLHRRRCRQRIVLSPSRCLPRPSVPFSLCAYEPANNQSTHYRISSSSSTNHFLYSKPPGERKLNRQGLAVVRRLSSQAISALGSRVKGGKRKSRIDLNRTNSTRLRLACRFINIGSQAQPALSRSSPEPKDRTKTTGKHTQAATSSVHELPLFGQAPLLLPRRTTGSPSLRFALPPGAFLYSVQTKAGGTRQEQPQPRVPLASLLTSARFYSRSSRQKEHLRPHLILIPPTAPRVVPSAASPCLDKAIHSSAPSPSSNHLAVHSTSSFCRNPLSNVAHL